MRIELICIGTELLRGKVNTHGAYISERLAEIDLFLAQETTVSDDPADMEQAFRSALERSDIVLNTGGLGPTFDDLTREAWSKILGIPLRRHPVLEQNIRRRFRARGLKMPPENVRQADVLQGSKVISNFVGTAPGQILEIKGKLVVLLPGPASEMYPMMENNVIPHLQKKIHPIPYGTFTLHTSGRPESVIDHKIRPVVERKRGRSGDEWLNFCILAHSYRVDVRAEARSPSARRLKSLLGRVKKELLRVIGQEVYGADSDTLESVIGQALARRRLKLAVAESCTGGLLSEMITRVPGSSRYFLGSFVAYSNGIKRGFLDVRHETLTKHGAVSDPVAVEMAKGARAAAHSDLGLSITGIAGPTGGSRKKPVGLVFIGLSGPARSFSRKFIFHGTREDIRQRSALTALDILRRKLLGK